MTATPWKSLALAGVALAGAYAYRARMRPQAEVAADFRRIDTPGEQAPRQNGAAEVPEGAREGVVVDERGERRLDQPGQAGGSAGEGPR